MRKILVVGIFAFCIILAPCKAENNVAAVSKAVEPSTLNQAGTKPFHLKAKISPSFERDKNCGRYAEVEI